MERHEWESRCDCHVRNLVKHQVNVCDSRCTCSLHEEWVTDIWLFTAWKLMVLRNSVIVFHEEKEWTASQHDLVTRTLPASSLSGCPFVHRLKNALISRTIPCLAVGRRLQSPASQASRCRGVNDDTPISTTTAVSFFSAPRREVAIVFKVSPLPSHASGLQRVLLWLLGYSFYFIKWPFSHFAGLVLILGLFNCVSFELHLIFELYICTYYVFSVNSSNEFLLKICITLGLWHL